MKKALFGGLLLLGLVVATVPGQQPAVLPDPKTQPKAEPKPDPAMVRLRAKVNPELPAYTRAQVIERCAEHLATINAVDRCRIRYFDMTAVPRQELPAMTSSLYFTANSTARIPITYVPRAVPNTDNRIFWIDLAWFNWTAETWESIVGEEPYTIEPILPSTQLGLSYLKDQTKANAVMRGDWFVYYATDNGEFLKGSEETDDANPKAFYYQLLYSNVEFEREVDDGKGGKVKKKVKGVSPDTTAELEKVWFVDFDHLKDFPVDKGVMVDKGFSGVAINNRIMWRVRTKIGVYWRTFDVFRTAGDQDFVENPFPKKFNAGEHIIQDERGAQYYHLSNGAGKTVDYADPFVVKGDPANAHNTVLVTGRSCIHCHDSGILPWRDEHQKIHQEGVDLKAGSYALAERFNQFYLQEQRMKRLLRGDQENYTAFIQEATGLTPQENMQNFVRARSWYVRDVTLEQAARELGVDVKTFSDALAYGPGTPDRPQGVTKGRLGRMILNGHPVPRHTWERGLYQEAGLLLLEARKAAKMREQGKPYP